MNAPKDAEKTVNVSGTSEKIDTPLTQPRSGPVRYEVIDVHGNNHGPFQTMEQACRYASRAWPLQEQDPDRAGVGWDVQVVGS
ncbi:hypothetical protein [Bradyrhizobium sp.]|jgi:hypothetical protein|uniref:hypothetical protein n=1 Tax=Bradyrhizobium sp. TaxID=376 RepID=UPI003C75421A